MRGPVRVAVWFVLAASVAAQLPEAWRHWRYSAPIDVGTVAPGRLVAVTVPAPVTNLARPDWIDLRVIDARGTEVPFVLHARPGGRSVTRRALPLLEPGVVDGGYRQAIVDTGENGVVHNSLELQIETERDLLSWVEVAVSPDLVDWRVVRDRAPIYVLRAEGMGEHTEVTYPDSASRYVRVRILDGSGSYQLTSVEIGHETTTVAERVPSGITLVTATGSDRTSVWTSDGDAGRVPVSRVAFETTRAAFVRSVTVEQSRDGERWTLVARGDILRGGDAADDRQWLSIDFAETRAPRWRITVDHRNDAPIGDLAPRLWTTPRHVVLRPSPGESYRLIFGHPRAAAPGYDLARLLDPSALDSAAPVPLGAVVANPDWVDPAPWTEQNEIVLWAALVLAVLTIGGVALRTLRSGSDTTRPRRP